MNPTTEKELAVSKAAGKCGRLFLAVVPVYFSFIVFCSPVVAQTTDALQTGKPIERELKAGETQQFQISLKQGEFLNATVNQRGIDVIVRIFAPDDSKIAEIDSPNGTQGDEPIALEAKSGGTYRIEVSSLEANAPAGRYEIRIDEIVSAADYAKRLAEGKRKQQVVISWLKDNQIPITTVEAGNGFADLQPLRKILKDVRFVGLGEATHGTREFFQFKHRMLEFLVREMGFRVFAIEASYSACQNVNDYVTGKTNDGAKTLDSLGFLVWNTEEVRTVMDWIRSYNADVPAEKQVKFVGFDILADNPGKAKLLDYLKRVAPERVTDTEAFFQVRENLLSNVASFDKSEKSEDALAKLVELKNKYDELFVFLELNETQLAAKSGQAEYGQMLEYARVLAQYLDYAVTIDGAANNAKRDFYMADNFRRLVAREPAGTKIIIWAHNQHISTADHNGAYPAFGNYLRRFYGMDYYALGFSFNQGGFQASDPSELDSSKRTMTAFTVGAAPADSVDWYLAQTGTSKFIVDFRDARKIAAINEWLAAPRPLREIGWGYDPKFDSQYFESTTIGKEYDGLFFISTTTRARPNPSVKTARNNKI